MHFNVVKLEKRLEKLEFLLKSTNDIDRKIELTRDIRSLKIMIAYASGTKKIVVNDDGIFDDSVHKKNVELVNFFNKYAFKIYKSLYCYSLGRRLPWRLIWDTKISDKEYFKLMESFLKEYDEKLLELYMHLKRNERIELCPRGYVTNKDALGLNVHLTTLNESYVLSRWNNKISSVSILPHELGHAFLMNDTYSTESLVYKNGTIFSEAYSIFLEIIFLDYLRNNGYSKNSVREEYSKLDSFLALADYHHGSILKLENLSICGDDLCTKDGNKGEVYTTKLILSNILGMYFADLYRNDRKKFMKEISCFFEMFGQSSEEDMIKHFDLDTMVEGSRHVMNRYIKNYRK